MQTECHHMRFIFQHSPPYGSHTSSISVVVLGLYWSKKSSTADMATFHLVNFSYHPHTFFCVVVFKFFFLIYGSINYESFLNRSV